MLQFSFWDILSNLLIATQWTIVLSLIAFACGGIVGLALLFMRTSRIPALRPEPSDLILYKTRFSGFFNTDLHDRLAARGVDTLIVTGCTTSVCVESTVRDAMFRDYRCLVLEDCTAEPIGATAPRTNHEASLLAMEILFAWISDSGKWRSALA